MYGSKSLKECQTSDAANTGFGLDGLSSSQPDVVTSAKLQDGGASQKGAKEPQTSQGLDV